VADSSSCRHLSQVGSSINPSLKRCPFRWQFPVSNPATHLNWSLFNLNRSFVLLAEGPDIKTDLLSLLPLHQVNTELHNKGSCTAQIKVSWSPRPFL
jgi:hypothetical protein